MSTLRKKYNKYYIRIRLPGGKEKNIPTGTGNRKEAERLLKIYQEREFLLKARLITEAELELLDLQSAVQRFLDDRKLTGRRPATIKSYELATQNLIDANSPNFLVSKLTRHHLRRVIDYLQNQERVPKDSTINIRIRSINVFMNWLHNEGYILDKIKLTQIKVDEPKAKFLTPDELDRLYAQVTNPKMLSTLKVYEGLGLRLSELHHSRLEGNFVVIPAEYSKSRRDRMIPISEELIERYLIAMNEPFSTHYITRTFHECAKKAGLPKRKTLHSLRYTFALRKLQETNNVVIVKELLGHASINTTLRYTNFPPEYIDKMLSREVKIPMSDQVAQA